MYWSLPSSWKIAYCVDILFITPVYQAYKARREARVDPETTERTCVAVRGCFPKAPNVARCGESLLGPLFLWMVEIVWNRFWQRLL